MDGFLPTSRLTAPCSASKRATWMGNFTIAFTVPTLWGQRSARIFHGKFVKPCPCNSRDAERITEAALAFEAVAPLHAARTSKRDVPTALTHTVRGEDQGRFRLLTYSQGRSFTSL